MRAIHRLCLLILVFVFVGGESIAEEVLLEPTQDALVFSGTPDMNWGWDTELSVGPTGLFEYRSYIQFDLSQLPNGIQLTEALLELYPRDTAPDFDMDAFHANMPWDEMTITWNNVGLPYVHCGTFSGDVTSGTTVVMPIDLESANDWYLDPDNNYGLVLMRVDPDYYVHVDFDSREHTSGLGPKLRVTYSYTSPAEPAVSPDELTMDWDYGDPSPSSSFDVVNNGIAPLNWTLSDDADWMTSTPESGTLAAGESQSVTVTVDSWPGDGTYNGTITVTDPDAVPPADSVTVTLTCHQAQLAVDPGAVDLTWNSYEPEVTGTFEVQNTGDADLDWTLAETTDWMTCTPVSGIITAGSSQTVTITTENWPGEGTFNDLITITDENAVPNEVTVDVSLTCVDIDMMLTLFPPTDPVIVAPGDSFLYDLQIDSWLDSMTLIDFWIQALLPNGNTITVRRENNIPIQPDETLYVADLSQDIPMIAPAGEYVYYVRAGDFPDQVIAEDSFGITVTGAALSGGADEWLADGFEKLMTGDWSETASVTSAEPALPDEFRVSSAYPNPFNPSTTFSVNLPEATELTVVVYNVAGQQIATLANGQYQAGSHTLTFDALHLSGGVYFVHATAGGWNDVQKVVLMK